jgi:hypothetical protein
MVNNTTLLEELHAIEIRNEHPKLSLGLAMTQKLSEKVDAYGHVVCFHLDPIPPHLELEHPWVWYHRLGPHACSLTILLEVELAINDAFELFSEGIYEGDEARVLACSLTPSIGDYHWLHGQINQLPSNHKTKHLIQIIQHILEFLSL